MYSKSARLACGFLGLCFCSATALASTISAQNFTGDSDSGISASNTYTHAVDLDATGTGTAETINGVPFANGGDGMNANQTGTDSSHGGGWSFSNPSPQYFAGPFADGATGNMNTLLSNFYYDGDNAVGDQENLTLSGLTSGTTYKMVFYCAGFGGAGGRVQNFSDSTGGAYNGFDEDQGDIGSTNGAPVELIDTYIANATSVTFTFTGQGANASMHQYGFSNQVAPEPGSIALIGLTTCALLIRRRCDRR
jgi:hypothetical protein